MATKKTSPKASEKSANASQTRRVNSFKPKKYEDHEIVDSDGKIVGHIRVKPSGLLWSPKNGKDWYGVSLDNLAKYIQENGKKQKN